MVSPEARAMLDQAAITSLHRGKFYVGVEYIYESLVANLQLLPPTFVQQHGDKLRQSLERVRDVEWQGVTPVTDTNEVYYTPRALDVIREACALAQSIRRGQTAPGHILLAIFRQDSSELCRMLDSFGMHRPSMVSELHDELIATTTIHKKSEPKPEEDAKEPPPTVADFSTDLTLAAQRGRLSKPYGRDQETRELVQALIRKEKNNVILIGNAGVGKTKIVEGLAVACASGEFQDILSAERIIELNLAALMSGTQYRGAFESKLLALLQELENNENTILFIDEIHMMRGAGATDGDGNDLANLLKPALARGKLRCIGATTPEEYRELVAKDPALERRFHVLKVEPLSSESTHKLLRRLKSGFERHHSVTIGSGTLSACVMLAERYLPRREFPDKAIDVLDQACARFRLKMVMAETNPKALKATVDPRVAGKVTPHDVKKVVSAMASLSLDELSSKERATLTNLDTLLNQRIIGQETAVARVVGPIRKSKVGMSDPNRPDASLFFVGPTGTGKTQLAKELANLVFGSSDLLYTFDMSEYSESHAVSRLLGAPPGYIGHEDDGLLYVYMLNTPYCVLLFDEIEKAHPQIYDVFLSMLDAGRLRDAKGREISFKHAIILFTSNAGADVLERSDSDDNNNARIMQALSKQFRPEFLNRIDAFVPFYPLRAEDVRGILRQMMDDIRSRLSEKKIGLRMYESAYKYLAEKGYSAQFGARELKRAVERYIADPISELLLQDRFSVNDMIDIRLDGERLAYEKGGKSKKASSSPPS